MKTEKSSQPQIKITVNGFVRIQVIIIFVFEYFKS